LKVQSLSANGANVYAEHPAIRTRASTSVQALSRYTVNKYETASEKVIASHPCSVLAMLLFFSEVCKVCFCCTKSSLRKACGMVQLWEKMGTADFQILLNKWTKANKILPPVDRVSKLEQWHASLPHQ
jgi:hypothetical protein